MGSSRCTESLHPTWESCVKDWANCCQEHNAYTNDRPMYYGVDWVSDASCCQLCNGGNWGYGGDM
eukprot:7958257-Ditylum_brightwellii.AAC.1